MSVPPALESDESSQPVTVLVRHVVGPGQLEAFRRWVSGISSACSEFEGYLGTEVIRPVGAATGFDGDDGEREWVVIFRFDSYANLQRWVDSPERHGWLDRGRDFASAEAVLEHHSLEFWFAPAGTSALPARYKMAVVTFLVIWPLVHFLPPAVGQALGDRGLLVEVISVATIVLLMTYVLMPLVNRLLRPLLVPR